MLVHALMLSFKSLSNPAVLSVLFKTLLLTLLAFVGIGALIWVLIDHFSGGGIWGVHGAAIIASILISLVCGWLLWRAIAIAVLWFFADKIVDAVEAADYPAFAATARRPGVMQSGQMALRSLGRMAGYNLIALPLYVVLLFTAIGTPIAVIGVNGLLLGRDLQDMLIARHGSQTAPFGKLDRLLLGLSGTAAMLLPFVNLLVPVVATAMAVHMAHQKHRAEKWEPVFRKKRCDNK